MKNYFKILFVFFVLLILIFSCAKSSENISNLKDSILTNKKDVRKTGNLELRVKSVLEAKNNILDYCEKYTAQIIKEEVYENSEDSVNGYFTIKVKAENFSVLFDDLTKLGKVIRVSIEAEDISDEKNLNNDRIELLKQRIKEAEKDNKINLADSLKEKLNNMLEEQKKINADILYSYIFLDISEKTKFIQSITTGFKIGAEGFYYAIKYTIIVIMYLIPAFIFLVVIRLLYALIKSKWKNIINKTEGVLDKKGKNNK